MRTGKLNQSSQGVLSAGVWQLVEEKIFTEAGTSYTFSGLDGDTAEEYRVIARVVNGYNGGISTAVRPNNDSTANIYGYQLLRGIDATASAVRGTTAAGFFSVNGTALNDVGLSDLTIHAKSGYVRTAISKESHGAGTTLNEIYCWGQSWNNTADNITSLVFYSTETNGLGVGTHLFLFKRSLLGIDASSGIKTGILNVQGAANCGIMQKIYQYDTIAQSISQQQTIATSTDSSLGDIGTNEYRRAQEFTLSADTIITALEVKQGQANYGTPAGNWTLRIETDNAGVPSGTLANTNATVDVVPPGANTIIKGTFASNFILSAGTYWIVITCANQTVNNAWYLAYAVSAGFAGDMAYSANGVWENLGDAATFYFKLYKDGPLTSITIPNLDGDTDTIYELRIRIVNGYAGDTIYTLTMNSDTGANYGYQYLRGINATVSAGRNSASGMVTNAIDGGTTGRAFSTFLIYSKSGYIRTGVLEYMDTVSGTTVTVIGLKGLSWNNTADNITSIVLTANQISGFGAGTVIELWALRKKL